MNRIFVVGSLNADLVIRAERIPQSGETLTGGDLQIFPGGKGANQAYAAARLGGVVSLAGRVGADAFGAMLRRSLQDVGVDCTLVEESSRPTGIAGITLLPSGENAILLSPGSNHDMTPEWIVGRMQSIAPGDIVLLQLEIPLEATTTAIQIARHRGARCILDPAPACHLSSSVLNLVDIITPNQTEIAHLLGDAIAVPRSYEQGLSACEKLRHAGAQQVVLKMGSLGCVLASESERLMAPSFEVDALDSTAAGDTFNAALAVALASGRPLEKALEFANAAGALSVTRAGAQASAPDLAEVDAFLRESTGTELGMKRR
jgi:ribokinase